MRRLIALFLSITMLLTGCLPTKSPIEAGDIASQVESIRDPLIWNPIVPQDFALDDERLLSYIEDVVYGETVLSLNNEDYFIENVSAIYISKEYIEELAFNSQVNIFYGYTLAELDEIFQGSRYIFTLDEAGQTTVKEMQEIEDNSMYYTMLKDVAIGTGVILVCVTISSVSAGIGAPAVSVIFAASAETGAIMALSSGALGALSAGVVTGIETGDLKESMKEALAAGAEGFKYGAIFGTIVGGAGKTFALKQATVNGLTMNEAAIIQKESKYPVDVIKEFSSMEEYKIYKKAELAPQIVDGRTALIRKIDLDYIDGSGVTNLERMEAGLAALDPQTGQAYELHHIGQKADSTLAILTKSEHIQGGNYSKLHKNTGSSEVHNLGSNWDAERVAFWKATAKILGGP